MRKNIVAIVVAMIVTAVSCEAQKEDLKEETIPDVNPPKTEEIEFVAKFDTFAVQALPWRVAVIEGASADTKIILYLHGGSARGDDNIAQMNEPGPTIIAEYLQKKGQTAIILVPQCPKTLSWGGKTNPALKGLLDKYVSLAEGTVKVYGFGGSMGGTGLGSLVSAYPEIFTAAMPVAWNPAMANASKMASVPFYTVMGDADDLMDWGKVTDFVASVKLAGGTAIMEIESGWTHGDTCTRSYTDSRLDWVFGR